MQRCMNCCIALVVLILLTLWTDCIHALLPQMQWINYDAYITSDRPPPRYDFAMGYDARRKFVYLFGGRTAAGQPLDDTWVLELNTFTWRRPSNTLTNRPPARYAAVSGMDQPGDQSRDSFIVALGAGQAGALDDVWSLDINNEVWFKVSVSGDGPGKVAGAVGGIDGNNKEPTQSLVVVGGVADDNGGGLDGSGKLTGRMDAAYALTLTGNWVRKEFIGTWTRMSLASGSQQPILRRNVGGAITANSRVALFGGCASAALSDCPLQDGSILSFPDQTVEVAKRGSPNWAAASTCQAPRFNPAIVRSPNTNYQNQFFVFGGAGSPLNGDGANGEVALLNGDTGVWSILQPAGSAGDVPFPKLRYGARMVATERAITPQSLVAGSDLIMFGGMDLSPDSDDQVLQDTWILRVFDRGMEGGDGTATRAQADTNTAKSPPTGPAAAGGALLDQTNGESAATISLVCPRASNPVYSHAAWMTAGTMVLPIALSVIRYARPAAIARRRYYIAYAVLMLISLGTSAYGIVLAYQMLGGSNPRKPFGHLRIGHTVAGLAMLLLAWVLVPISAGLIGVLVRVMRRQAADQAGQDIREINFDEYSQRHLNMKDAKHTSEYGDREENEEEYEEEEEDCGDIDARSTLSGGGFEVLNRPGSQRSRPSISAGTGVGLGRSSFDRSRPFDPVDTLAALYAQAPAPDPVPTFGPDNPHPATLSALAVVTRWRRVQHVFAHLVHLALQGIAIAALFSYLPSIGFFAGYLAYILLFCLAWAVAAWFGYPRRSLLASGMTVVGGRGNPPSTYPLDTDSMSVMLDPITGRPLSGCTDKLGAAYAVRGRRSMSGGQRGAGTTAHHPVDPITAAAIGLGSIQGPVPEEPEGTDEDDDGRRQERMEQEMAGRDVVIMTIPKRRLTVVNA